MSATPSRPSSQVTSPSTVKRTSQVEQASAEDTGTHQLAVAVDDLLDQLQHRFTNVSNEIFGKLDDMTRRLDELEASLTNTNEGDRGT